MQKMSPYFEEFRKAIEPDPKRKKEAQQADDPVREHLATHASFADRHEDTFLYGSYKRSTTIGDIKDVDIVVVTNYTTSDKPVAVLNELKDALAELYDEPDLADQRRSIRIDRPLPDVPDSELTLDVIPAIYWNDSYPDQPLWVPDRDKNKWVPSHPKGHIAYSSELNARSHQERAFVRLTKMMKWWWKYQFERQKPHVASHERKPKGFWIEVMTGTYADLSHDSYPALIVTLLTNALTGFEASLRQGKMPTLPDPGLWKYTSLKQEDRIVKTSMTSDEFAFFFKTMTDSLAWAKAACEASDEETAAIYWRLFFGDKFPPKLEGKTTSSLLRPAIAPTGLTFPDKPVIPRKPGGFA